MMTLQQLLPDRRLPAPVGQVAVQGLQLDSRALVPGQVFIAVPGVSTDGRRFIDQAVEAGAVAVLGDAAEFAVHWRGDVPCIDLPGLAEQSGELAACFYGQPDQQLNITGVTGTNGKTSITWFLRDALDALGYRCALVGTLGIGLKGQQRETGHTTPDPVTLQAGLAEVRAAGADTVAMEVSSHALDQNRLSRTRVPVAVFSNLSRDHLDYHGDMEAYLAAKSALFTRDGLELAVVNGDDPAAFALIGCLRDGVRCVTFGGQDGATVRCESHHCGPTGLQAQIKVGGVALTLDLPLFGTFNLSNVMAVAAVLHGMQVPSETLSRALQAVTPVPGRMEPIQREDGPTVIVDYAHTPDALDKALQACRAHFSGKVHCVVGCGGDRDAGKRPQMAAVAEQGADQLVLTSDNPRSEPPQQIIDAMVAGLSEPDAAYQQADRALAVAQTVARAADQDVILLAGKGHEDYQEIHGTRHPSDDRVLAMDALEQRLAQGGAQ